MAQLYGVAEGHVMSVTEAGDSGSVTSVQTGESYPVVGSIRFGPYDTARDFYVSGGARVVITPQNDPFPFSRDRTPEDGGVNPALNTSGQKITDMLVAMRTSYGGGRVSLTPGVTYTASANTAARTLGGTYLFPTNFGAIMVPPGRFALDGWGALLKAGANGTVLLRVEAERDRTDVVTGPMDAGSNVFQIGAAAAANWAIGDKAMWKLGDISYDLPETYNYKHARVTAVDAVAGTVTLDRYLSAAWDGTGTNNKHLWKIANCEGSVFGDFNGEPLTTPDLHGTGLMSMKYQNDIRVRSLTTRGASGGSLSMNFCENVHIGTVASYDAPNTELNRGIAMRIAESRGIRVDSLIAENIGRHALVAEAASEIAVGLLHNHNTIEAETGPGMAIITSGGRSSVHVEKLLMTGLGGNAAFGTQDNGRVSFGEVITNTATPIWVLPTPGINCRSLSMTIDGVEERYEADKFVMWERIIWLTDGMTGAAGNGEALIPVNGGLVTECMASLCGTTSARPVQDDFTNLYIGRTGNSTNMKTSVPAVADGLPISLLSAYNNGSAGAYAGANQWTLRAQRPRVAIVTPASGRNLNGSGKYIVVRMKVHPNVLAAQLDMGTAPHLMDAGLWEPEGSKTHDFASIAANGSETTTLTVTGAELGDIATASLGVGHGGLIITAWVSAANTVTVEARNPTGAAIDLASTTIRVRVSKPRLGA